MYRELSIERDGPQVDGQGNGKKDRVWDAAGLLEQLVRRLVHTEEPVMPSIKESATSCSSRIVTLPCSGEGDVVDIRVCLPGSIDERCALQGVEKGKAGPSMKSVEEIPQEFSDDEQSVRLVFVEDEASFNASLDVGFVLRWAEDENL